LADRRGRRSSAYRAALVGNVPSAGYCGFPRAINATRVAREVFAERGLLPVEDTR
jgi:hypothetical protein